MVLSSPSSFGNRFHWHPLRSRKMMPLSPWVRALAAPGFGRVFLQDDRFDPFPKLSGTSQMVSSVSCFPMRSLPMLLEKPYESS